MNINFKFLLLGTSLSLIPNLLYAQCAETDCLKLGYTTLQKCDNGLKCPFGEYWACPKVEEKTVLGQCSGNAKNCKIGDILNSDGTCGENRENEKLPIGIVIYISPENCGWAMTANPIATGIPWSTEFVKTGIGTTTSWSNIGIFDFDACENTAKMIKLSGGNKDKYPAAWEAVNYSPAGASATKGKWCLPSPGMLDKVHLKLGDINTTISKLGGTTLTINKMEYIWSSSESGATNAWVFCLTNHRGDYGTYPNYMTCNEGKNNDDNYYTIRPVIEF